MVKYRVVVSSLVTETFIVEMDKEVDVNDNDVRDRIFNMLNDSVKIDTDYDNFNIEEIEIDG